MKICSLVLISLLIACNSESEDILRTVTPINEEITSTSTPLTPKSENPKGNPHPTKTIQNLETTPIPTIPKTIPTQVTTHTPTSIPTTIPTATPTTIPTSTPTAIPTATPTAIPTATPTAIPTPYSTQIPQSEYPTAECVDGTKSYNMNPWDGTTCSNNGGISMYLENPGSENSSGNYSYTPTPTPTPTPTR